MAEVVAVVIMYACFNSTHAFNIKLIIEKVTVEMNEAVTKRYVKIEVLIWLLYVVKLTSLRAKRLQFLAVCYNFVH